MVVVVLAKGLAGEAPLAELAGETGDGMGSASGVVEALGAVESGRGIFVGPAADVRAAGGWNIGLLLLQAKSGPAQEEWNQGVRFRRRICRFTKAFPSELIQIPSI